MGSGLEGFDFFHEGMKPVVGLLTGFVSVIASAPHCFLYHNQRIYDIKKRKKKEKKALLGVGDLQAHYNSHSHLQARYSSLSLFSHTPPLRLIWRPHSHQRIYRWQRSQATRAAAFPQCLRQWTYEGSVREGWHS